MHRATLFRSRATRRSDQCLRSSLWKLAMSQTSYWAFVTNNFPAPDMGDNFSIPFKQLADPSSPNQAAVHSPTPSRRPFRVLSECARKSTPRTFAPRTRMLTDWIFGQTS